MYIFGVIVNNVEFVWRVLKLKDVVKGFFVFYFFGYSCDRIFCKGNFKRIKVY